MFVTTKNSQYFNDAESLAYRFINKANELFPDILRRQETFKYDREKMRLTNNIIRIQCLLKLVQK